MAKPKKPLPAAPRRPPPLVVPADVAAQFVATGDVPNSPTAGGSEAFSDVRKRSQTSLGALQRLEVLPDVRHPSPTAGAGHERPETSNRTARGRVVARQSGERARRTVYLSTSTDTALDAYCRTEGREVSWVVEQAVRRFLGQ
jgi:hypothetical protein